MFIVSPHAHSRSLPALSSTFCLAVVFQILYSLQADAIPFESLRKTQLQTPTDEKLNSQSAEIENIEPIKLDNLNARKGKLIEQAKRSNLMPLPTLVDDAEEDAKLITDANREKEHLFELWEATLCRSPDIQFVVQKLMPSSDKNRTNTAMLRTISAIISNGVNAGTIAYGANPFAMAGSQLSSNMLQSFFNLQDAKGNALTQIDQGQILTLYQMVRGIADSVSETYRDYKFYVRKIDSAQARALKFQGLIQETRTEQDALKQVELEYINDKLLEDIGDVVYMARRHRQKLVDFAGNDSVSKVDKSFEEQFLEEKEIERKNGELAEADRPKVPDITREAISRLLKSANSRNTGH